MSFDRSCKDPRISRLDGTPRRDTAAPSRTARLVNINVQVCIRRPGGETSSNRLISQCPRGHVPLTCPFIRHLISLVSLSW
jgi:hypothetical protein